MLSLLNTTFTNTLRQGSTLIGSLLSKLKARSTYFENKACTKTTLGELNSAGLLKKASIITTPTAYNNGFIHSVKPEENLGAELITNGDFSNGSTDWVLDSQWQIINNQAVYNGDGSNNTFRQAISIVQGKKYRVQFNVISIAGTGKVQMQTSIGTSFNTIGIKTFDIEIVNSPFTTISFARSSGVVSMTLDNVSVKEIIGADLPFTRNSEATRGNSQSLVESVQILGSNVVTNGDFATNADWTAGDGWSFGGNKASCDGTQTDVTGLIQTISTNIQNQLVKISFTLDISAGTLSGSLNNTGGAEFNALTTSGNYSVEATSSDVNPTILFLGDTNFVGSISNVVIEPATDDTNLPRIDYTGGGCGSWLIEPQTTNLITYSEDYTDNSWGHNTPLTITPNYALSPDGTHNATRLNRIGTGNRIGKNISLEAGKTYNFSFYMKNNGGTSALNIRINGQVGLPLQSYTISNNFERYSFNFTATTTVTSEVRVFTAAVDIDLFLWGVQLEEKAFATSYIPTIGSTRTRNRDVANPAGNSDLISSTEGVLYAEIAALADAGYDRMISLSDGSNSNNLRIELDSSSNKIRTAYKNTITSGTSQSVALQFDLTDTTQFFKVAVLYNQNDFKLYINGVLRDSVAMSIPILPSNTFDGLRFSRGDLSFRFEGKIKCLAVFKETLTDAELVALTTA